MKKHIWLKPGWVIVSIVLTSFLLNCKNDQSNYEIISKLFDLTNLEIPAKGLIVFVPLDASCQPCDKQLENWLNKNDELKKVFILIGNRKLIKKHLIKISKKETVIHDTTNFTRSQNLVTIYPRIFKVSDQELEEVFFK